MAAISLPLASSCASSVSYDKDKQALTVTYRGSGKSYTYYEVPEWRFKDLLRSGSTGKFINDQIKPYYPYR